MAKPYRRRKGRHGSFVGNYRVTVDGRDLNLGTKDATEAHARARLAVRGKWPPEEAAARAALAVLDPATPPIGEPPELYPGGPVAPPPPPGPARVPDELPIGDPPPQDPGGAAAEPPAEPLDVAAAAAAADASGDTEQVTAEKLGQEQKTKAELDEVMRELVQGGPNSEFVDSIADGCAAFLLWAERKSIELGWKWTLTGSTGRTLKTESPGAGSMARKALRVGLKAVALEHFPEISTRLTPGWAIGIGLLMGGVHSVVTAQLVDVDTGRVQSMADAMAAAKPNAHPPAA